jgi:hypothetical protein
VDCSRLLRRAYNGFRHFHNLTPVFADQATGERLPIEGPSFGRANAISSKKLRAPIAGN